MDAAKTVGISIPTLCYFNLSDFGCVNKSASCRVCVVEIEGIKELKTACSTKITKGMKIYTDSNKVKETRKVLLDLLLSNHDYDCLKCNKKYKLCK